MKQTFLLFLIGATLASSCKKSSNNTPTKTGTVLLTKVTNILPGDPNVGKPLAEFTYNGTQLSKAVTYTYTGISALNDIETDLFNYNSQGQLTGTTILHTYADTNDDDVSSTITYNGSNISEIRFYKAGNILDKDIKLTYQNGKLTNWLNANEVSENYSYDSNGNVTKDEAIEYQNGIPDGEASTTTNSTFDSNLNLSQAIPYWIYFRVYHEDQSFTYTPGVNNPVTANDGGSDFTFSYQYSNYKYPSSITWTDSYPQSYQYDYIQIN